MELKDTLNLPKTDFPMRASLVEQEPSWIQKWADEGLYEKIQAKNKGNPILTLHDGPPFTNGDVHIGTALNKILKDVILKFHSMNGYATPWIPGWDCHGLPIEYKVTKELHKTGDQTTPAQMRKACAEFSAKFIEKQKQQFKRLGVLADWANEYKTMDPAYEAEILRTLATIAENGLIYRSNKPVYWSIPCQTALAEAEIEYQNHTSPSIFVSFELKNKQRLSVEETTYIPIWTTTPWTLPANVAIAVHPNITYREVFSQEKCYVVADPLVEAFIKACKLPLPRLGKTHPGKVLEGLQAQHPFIESVISKVILAEYVTTEAGTGCVHTAPGHGPDDYQAALKYGLEIYSPVDAFGKYTSDSRMPKSLVGLSVLSKNGHSEANDKVLELLRLNGALLAEARHEHQYPFCWRSKTPVIFRAIPQWFVRLEDPAVAKRALEAVKSVSWVPQWSEKRMLGSLQGRPDWCISRQRAWGVPIPVFYDETETPLLNANVIRHIAEKIEKQGSNLWFESSEEALLEGIELPEEFKGKRLKKSTDTLDVWLDSGTSHLAVLKKRSDVNWPADIYFEGSDQHRGWFQSSLWTSVLSQGGKAPYKKVITHGFVVNEQKKKISKSDQKPQTADLYVEQYGADVLRLWISSEDYRNDVPISENILKQITQTYRNIRNTFRFQLGSLHDFDPIKNSVPWDSMTLLDQWVLHETYRLIQETTESYSQFEFHKAYQGINRFCNNTLSAVYHDILKDRLYTYAPNWPERRAAQTALYQVLKTLLGLLAPILSFTTEEAFDYLQREVEKAPQKSSIHLMPWPVAKKEWFAPQVAEILDALFAAKVIVNERLEGARQNKIIGQSLDASVTIVGSLENAHFKILQEQKAWLPEFFITSQVLLREDKNALDLRAEVMHAEGVRCPRSWRWVSHLEWIEPFGEVSERCKRALSDKYN